MSRPWERPEEPSGAPTRSQEQEQIDRIAVGAGATRKAARP